MTESKEPSAKPPTAKADAKPPQAKATPPPSGGAAKPTPPKAAPSAKPAPTGAKPAAPKQESTKAEAKPATKPGPAKGEKKPSIHVVDKPVAKPQPKKHVARAKPKISKELGAALVLRRGIDGRRPAFRRQQWYEYRRLADSGWRKPRGVDSAMRRHFGYEQSVVRIGFRGPVESRGLHPSGFREVRVDGVVDLARIDPATQAARISGSLGRRTLELVYAEADKRKIRILNRRDLK